MKGSPIQALASRLARRMPTLEVNPNSSPEEISALVESVRESTISLQHQYNGSIASLTGQITTIVEKISVLYPAMNVTCRSLLEESRRNSVLEGDNHKLSSQLQAASQDLSQHKQLLASVEGKIEALSLENSALKEKCDTQQGELSRLGEAVDALEHTLSSERRNASDLEARERAAQARLTKRETELLETKHQVARLTNDYGEAKLSAEARQKMLQTLSESYAAEQAARAKSDSLLMHANSDLQVLQHDLRRTEREFEAVRKRQETAIERSKAEVAELKLANTALQSKVNALEKIVKSQRVKADGSTTHMAYLQGSLRKLLWERSDEIDRSDPELALILDKIDERDLSLEATEPSSQAAVPETDNEAAEGFAPGEGVRVIQLMASAGKKK